MAKMMNDEQRLAILEGYNPQEHLIEVAKDKDRKPVLYYPAAWRLYELRLRHPHFTLESEIIHMDVETNLVIIQAVGYDGLDYASSSLKGRAMKQGKLSELDKVETKAKSRVARDVGIGTEYALDIDEDEVQSPHPLPQRPTKQPQAQQPAQSHGNPAQNAVAGAFQGQAAPRNELNRIYGIGLKAGKYANMKGFSEWVQKTLKLQQAIDVRTLKPSELSQVEAAVQAA